MKLYHFTVPSTYLRIAAYGLTPHASFMTAGIPVVWLTRQESNRMEAQHFGHMNRVFGGADRDIGDCMFGSDISGATARLTVHIERHDKRLMRYADILRRLGTHMKAIREVLIPDALTCWWVYQGIIPPHKIEPATVSVVAECLDWHIKTHPNIEARAQFKAQRERLATCPPDAPCAFELEAAA
jgi:hypothetical protein